MENYKLKIDVYEKKTNLFIGTRYTSCNVQEVNSNKNEINNLVGQICKQKGKKINNVHFKTTAVKVCKIGDTVMTPYGVANVIVVDESTMSARVKHQEAKTPVTDFKMEHLKNC